MNKDELLQKMLILCSEHLDSLEVYEEFPGVKMGRVDDAKHFVQEILRAMAENVYRSKG